VRSTQEFHLFQVPEKHLKSRLESVKEKQISVKQQTCVEATQTSYCFVSHSSTLNQQRNALHRHSPLFFAITTCTQKTANEINQTSHRGGHLRCVLIFQSIKAKKNVSTLAF
jgi:hypothetical protein